MFDNYFDVDIDDHVLKFNGLVLIDAQFEPDYGCFIDVEFGADYFISGETGERVDITTRYRGLKGTPAYQVDLLVGDRCVKTFMVQLTPMGEILTPKEDPNGL